MKQVVVLSGKGGTGKTTVTAALADRAARDHRLVMVDADVDAANLGILLDPRPGAPHAFEGGASAVIDEDACALCGSCVDVCRFEAVGWSPDGRVVANPIRCEGCGACTDVCPSDAIRVEAHQGGTWWKSETERGTLFHADLAPAEDNSGKLVALLRREAREAAAVEGAEFVLIDGPPGIGCPAIAAATGTDFAVVVTEPSLFGTHDLVRALDLLAHFDVPAIVCVNRADLAPGRTEAVHAVVRERGLPTPIDIPYDPAVLEAVRACRTLGRDAEGPASVALTRLWQHLEAAVCEQRVGT